MWKHSDDLTHFLNKARGKRKVGNKQRKARQKRPAKEANRLLTNGTVRSSGALSVLDSDVCSINGSHLDETFSLETRKMEGVLRTREIFGKNRECKL